MMSAKNRLRNGVAALFDQKRLSRTLLLVLTAWIAACADTSPVHSQAPINSSSNVSAKPPSDLSQSQRPSTTSAKPAPQEQRIQWTAYQQPQQIALLLPLNGRLAGFGIAVRDGFMAAYYDARAHGVPLPNVRIYDTTESPNFIELYQRAIAEGAQAIIGPLEKSQVAALYTQQNGAALSVPTLALNRADNFPNSIASNNSSNNTISANTNTAANPPANLYQFGLAPEDEATEISRMAAQQKFKHALVVADDEDRRSRELQTFTQSWQQSGGDIAATAFYRDAQSMSQSIKTALNIPQSEARKREMEILLGRKVEFAPHRRSDIDMIFLLARPQQARSIMPTLAFHYAGDIPVYALSRSYNGVASADDKDLEGLRFTEIPWVLDAQQPLKQQLLASSPQAQNYLRLYALGVDSFSLYPQLRRLETQPDSRIVGQTGYLTLSPQRIVQRELLLAEFKDGLAKIVTMGNPGDNAINAAGFDSNTNNNDSINNGRESPNDSIPENRR